MAKTRHTGIRHALDASSPTSPDPNFTVLPSGLTVAPVGFSGEGVTGTPPAPRIRGNTQPIGNETLPRGDHARKNTVIDSFFQERK